MANNSLYKFKIERFILLLICYLYDSCFPGKSRICQSCKKAFFICKQELNSRGNTLKHIFLLCAGWGGFLSLTGLETVLSVGAPAHCGSSGIAGPHCPHHRWSEPTTRAANTSPDLQSSHLGCRWWWNRENCWHDCWENQGEMPGGLD